MTISASNETPNMALFCDFENMVLGARDAKFEAFDINMVLNRLLLKGDIVVKKAYCDWHNYKDSKREMHSASFELIEVPHVTQSGKNSADIRMVVDALDLCYTKAHVDAFVIISGDSDFSPLVSKLRENNKTVIGVGIRAATSDLLRRNCNEFIFYDDLVKAEDARKSQPAKPVSPPVIGTKEKKSLPNAAKPNSKVDAPKSSQLDKSEADRQQKALDMIVETVEGLLADKGREDVHASHVKSALKRRYPGFSEAAYGFKGTFNKVLEEGERRGVLSLRKADTNLHVALS
jgi:uncharacterized protein (TIGR00288 family)